ncbi:MAG TPA: S53 family peptidase [Solirubrobacteraceae bacterium]|nr:S53 family peptidase [Solirubrobacteraceae bacterium]
MPARRAAIATIAVALLVAGCGGGSSAPGRNTRGGAPLNSQQVAHLQAFAACMRAHGVARMPSVDGNGHGGENGNGQLDLNSPVVKSAIKTCIPTAHGTIGANLEPVGVSGTAPNPANSPQAAGATGDCDSLTTCYTARQLETAYGITPLLAHGINGHGQTVVLPEIAQGLFPPHAYTDLRQDMRLFDKAFGLPAPHLRVINSIAESGSPWQADGEEVLDAEMVHAAAPGAAITIVLIKPSSFHNAAGGVAAAVAALQIAVTNRTAVVSISAAGQTGGENCDTPTQVKLLNSALQNAVDHHITVVAASGDIGAVGEPCDLANGLMGGSFPPVKEVNLPASDPLVLAAGGTTLTATHKTGGYISETGWGLPYGSAGTQFQASGGGFSRVFARPSYQASSRESRAGRGVPDVASDAAPHTGMALIVSNGAGGYTIRNSGGTSASAPLWAGIIALADQYAGRQLGFVNPAIYRIGRSASYPQAFHDITQGNNTPQFPGHTITGYKATPGWDPVTGWGSPNAQALIPLLVHYSNQ